jgi:hypothetical protein
MEERFSGTRDDGGKFLTFALAAGENASTVKVHATTGSISPRMGCIEFSGWGVAVDDFAVWQNTSLNSPADTLFTNCVITGDISSVTRGLTLANDINESQTTFVLSGTGASAGMWMYVGNMGNTSGETTLVTLATGSTVTVTRAYNGTTAQSATAGDSVWDVTPRQTIFSPQPLSTLSFVGGTVTTMPYSWQTTCTKIIGVKGSNLATHGNNNGSVILQSRFSNIFSADPLQHNDAFFGLSDNKEVHVGTIYDGVDGILWLAQGYNVISSVLERNFIGVGTLTGVGASSQIGKADTNPSVTDSVIMEGVNLSNNLFFIVNDPITGPSDVTYQINTNSVIRHSVTNRADGVSGFDFVDNQSADGTAFANVITADQTANIADFVGNPLLPFSDFSVAMPIQSITLTGFGTVSQGQARTYTATSAMPFTGTLTPTATIAATFNPGTLVFLGGSVTTGTMTYTGTPGTSTVTLTGAGSITITPLVQVVTAPLTPGPLVFVSTNGGTITTPITGTTGGGYPLGKIHQRYLATTPGDFSPLGSPLVGSEPLTISYTGLTPGTLYWLKIQVTSQQPGGQDQETAFSNILQVIAGTGLVSQNSGSLLLLLYDEDE